MSPFQPILIILSVIQLVTSFKNGVADSEEFPFHAQIYKLGKFRCSGAILSPYHILTAGTCLHKFPADKILVLAGTTEFQDQMSDFAQTRQADNYVLHPSYVATATGDFANSLGIIYLKEPFVFNSHVNAISLPKEEKQLKSGVRIGFGVANNGSPSPHLKKLEVDFTDRQPCNDLMKRVWKRDLRKKELCGKSDFKSVDVCVLDTGSPIICEDSSTEFLCGLDALTINMHQCEDVASSIANNILEQLPFIQDVLQYTNARLKCDPDHIFSPASRTCLPRSSICNKDFGEVETCKSLEPCNEFEFRCNDGTCLEGKSRCDGKNDCEKNKNEFLSADEEKCASGEECPKGLYSCGAGDRCFPVEWRCDGVKDCKNGSDEESCGKEDPEEGKISTERNKNEEMILIECGDYFSKCYKEKYCFWTVFHSIH